MIRRWAPYLALIVLLGGIGGVSAITVKALHHELDPGEAKLRAADRIIGYQVFADRGPLFRLRGGPTRLKLVSNAVVDGRYDPERVTSYGFRVTVRDGVRDVWHGDVFIQSRESKARWDGVRWQDEAAWGADPIELTDERVVILELPDVPASATLTMTLLGAPHEAVIRMFREEPRTDAQRLAAQQRLDATERADLVRSSTYVPWQLLSAEEQDARLTHRWFRMAAIGNSGVDVTTRTIYLTNFRLPFAAAAKEGIEVARDRDAAINVHGPAHIVLAALTGTVGELEVTEVGAADIRPLAIDGQGGIDVGPAPVTLIVRTQRAEPMRFAMSGPPDVLIAPEDARPPAPGELVPDHVRVPLVVAGPTTTVSVPVRAIADMPLLGRGVRIDARDVVPAAPAAGVGSAAPAPTAATDEFVMSSLTVTYVGADGRHLGAEPVLVGGGVSRFEQLSFAGAVSRVTEPTSVRLLPPVGTVRIDLTADHDIALRLYRWAPGQELLEPPYRALAIPEHRWRYARLVERSWFPMLPSNDEALAAAGRLAQLDAQVRLEPILPAEHRPGIADYRPLVPSGHPEQQRAREPVPPDELAAVLTTWPAGSLTTIAAGSERVINFAASIASRPRVSWAADPSAVGGELVVMIDDQRVRLPMATSASAADLPRIPPGLHRVRVDGPARELWIDRPPGDGATGVVRERTLYRLGLGGLSVRVPQRAEETVHVYAIVYAPAAAAVPSTTLVMTVDGRRPARRSGITNQLTSPEVRVPMPAARRTAPAVLVDLGGRPAGLPRSVGIGVLADLVAGSHGVDLYRLGGDDLWVRFVTTQRLAGAPEPTREWSPSPGPTVEVLHD